MAKDSRPRWTKKMQAKANRSRHRNRLSQNRIPWKAKHRAKPVVDMAADLRPRWTKEMQARAERLRQHKRSLQTSQTWEPKKVMRSANRAASIPLPPSLKDAWSERTKIRRGRSLETKIDPYKSHGLDPDQVQIRILHLLSGSWEDPVCATLSVASLGDKPYYEALSYVWGDANYCLEITLDGLVHQVTMNLWTALRRCKLSHTGVCRAMTHSVALGKKVL